jgi:hypothetical protein
VLTPSLITLWLPLHLFHHYLRLLLFAFKHLSCKRFAPLPALRLKTSVEVSAHPTPLALGGNGESSYLGFLNGKNIKLGVLYVLTGGGFHACTC